MVINKKCNMLHVYIHVYIDVDYDKIIVDYVMSGI